MPCYFIKFFLLAALSVLSLGCSQNFYNIPKDTYGQKVRVLGIAPIFVDLDSDIRHPERDTLVNLLKDHNRKNEQELVAMLKDRGNYFSVQFLGDDPDKLFSSLFFRRERREDAGIVYNKYFFKGPELKNLIKNNGLDALMLVVMSGITKQEKIYSSNLLSSLATNYNYLIISSQILDPDGNTLWEFPNFRQLRLSYPTFFNLQFPDFDEAKANMTDNVEVKFKSIPGINRTLTKGSASSLRAKATISDDYGLIFDEMLTLLNHKSSLFGSKRKALPPPSASPAPVQPQQSPSPEPANVQQRQPQPASAPAATVAPTIPAEQLGGQPAQTIKSPAIAPAN